MISIDVMGGDFAPHAILAGSIDAAKLGVEISLFGPEDQVSSLLFEMDPSWQSYPIKIFHTSEVIEMTDEPALAVRKKQNSSMVMAVKSVALGNSDAVISAGNSGAFMAASAFILGRTHGIERPAIAGFIPSKNGSVLCLDLGANTDCKPHYLVQFAQLGSDYLKNKFGIKNPKIGLLSNGSEPLKGSLLIKEVYPLLEESGLNFIGNIEPDDLVNEIADLVVCDGFVGNILLKTAEGVSGVIIELINQKLAEEDSLWGREFLKFVYDRTSWIKQGGAVLLGINGNAIVVHGKACSEAIKNAILLANKISQGTQIASKVMQAKMQEQNRF